VTDVEERLQTAVNDVTGDPIKTRVSSEKFRENFKDRHRTCTNCIKRLEGVVFCDEYVVKPEAATCIKFRSVQ